MYGSVQDIQEQQSRSQQDITLQQRQLQGRPERSLNGVPICKTRRSFTATSPAPGPDQTGEGQRLRHPQPARPTEPKAQEWPPPMPLRRRPEALPGAHQRPNGELIRPWRPLRRSLPLGPAPSLCMTPRAAFFLGCRALAPLLLGTVPFGLLYGWWPSRLGFPPRRRWPCPPWCSPAPPSLSWPSCWEPAPGFGDAGHCHPDQPAPLLYSASVAPVLAGRNRLWKPCWPTCSPTKPTRPPFPIFWMSQAGPGPLDTPGGGL
jgi:hypothetical protein